jgi:PilZ domain
MSSTAQADSKTEAPASGSELRQHPRIVCVDGGALRLSVRPEFRGRRAVLIDISSGGIGFVMEEPLPTGTTLVFELSGHLEIDSVGRLARVRHCRPHPMPADAPWLPPVPVVSRFFRNIFRMPGPRPEGHAWLVGCEFDRPLSDAEMQQIAERLNALANRPE